MQYILNSAVGAINYGRYNEYISSIRKELPAHVYQFAANPNHFDLESPNSLHDAWLETLTIREKAQGDRRHIREIEIELRLLGPRHDRWIDLNYTEVSKYSFVATGKDGERYSLRIAHGDLVTHEIRLGREGRIIHELLFERDATLLIECRDIQHREALISGDRAP